MSRLLERVDHLREVFTVQVSAEIKAVMSGGTEDLCAPDTVRLELENLSGNRYTDLFTLLRVDGKWEIMNKVFHLHT